MSQNRIEIPTMDGACPAILDMPEGGAKAGVILYMDIFGLRPAMEQMAARYAAQGYAVLVPDLFYRFGDYGPFDAATAFSDEATTKQLRGMLGDTTQAMTERDTAGFLDALDKAGVSGPVGTVGYCMGGARALTAAAGFPDRVTAAASLHGGNLASDDADSPHRRASEMTAALYVGVAGEDKSFPPEQSAVLAQALRSARLEHMVENYADCAHGWAVPDHGVYHEKGAERHWTRMLDFFGEWLG